MAALPTIPASAPTVIPAVQAQAQQSAGIWWPYSVVMDGSDSTNFQIKITIRKGYLAADGLTIIFTTLVPDKTLMVTQAIQIAQGTIAPASVGLSAGSATYLANLLTGLLNAAKSIGNDQAIL